jgi:transcriptional regulator with XRE-family HTH domain
MIGSPETLAERARVAMARADVKIGQFAQLAGLSRDYLSRVLHGQTVPGELAEMKIQRAISALAERRGRVPG